MKAYFAGPGPCSDEYDWCDLVFAESWKEARKLAWAHGDSRDYIDGEYIRLKVERRRQYDRLFPLCKKQEPHVCREDAVLRLAGWRMEYDAICGTCGLASMDGVFPVCEDCGQCKDCGHTDGCEQAPNDTTGDRT